MSGAFAIAGRPVGGGAPCYVIAEAGSNHNRDLAIARRLIDAAADAGADAVKFQTFSGATLYSRKTPEIAGLEGNPQDALEALALPREWQPELAEHARERGVAFFSSPFDHDAVDQLAQLGVPALKIASYEIVDLELIAHAASVGVPIIVSTGMATEEEVADALGAVRGAGNEQVAALACTSLYPAPPEAMNLRAMATLRERFDVPAGLSDHSLGTAVPIAAAALGAELIEKHFTLDRGLPGPDHSFALEPAELKQMVDGVRAAQAALGDGRLDGPSEAERPVSYRIGRRSVIAAQDIPAGTVIERAMLTVKRPGFGIAPKRIDEVVGRRAQRDIELDDVVTWEMVDPG